MNKPAIFIFVLAAIALVALNKYGFFDSESVSLCKEAMRLNAKQLNPGKEGQEKLLQGCLRDANNIPADRWRCVIEGMKKGGAYRETLTQCTS